MQNFIPAYIEGEDVRTDVPRGSIDYQIFLPMALRCALFARESSATKILWGNNAWAKRGSSAGRLVSYEQALKVYIKRFLKGLSPQILSMFSSSCVKHSRQF